MSQGLAGSSQKNYGSTSSSRIPDVSFSGSGNQFSPTELYDLSDQISTSIQKINGSLKQLEQNFKIVGTPRDSLAFRNKIQETQSKSNAIIIQTTKDIQRLTAIVKRGDKKQKLQVDKLTSNFKEVIQMYSTIQKKIVEKFKVSILQVELKAYDDYAENESMDEEQKLMMKQEKVNKELEFEKGLLIEREQRVKEIESSVLDINQIMKELAALVYEQSDSINTIEDNIETSHSEVEAGQRELQKAESYQDNRRRKTCILLGIAVFIGFILTLIIVLSVKN